MHKYFIFSLIFLLSFLLTGCNNTNNSKPSMSSYNSQRLQNIKNQYEENNKTDTNNENQKYAYSDNVLKIDLK